MQLLRHETLWRRESGSNYQILLHTMLELKTIQFIFF